MMLHLKKLPTLIAFALLLIPATSVVSAAQEAELESVIVHTTSSLADLTALIESVGGEVKQQYENLNAVAAELPAGALDGIQGVDEISVTKDGLVSAPGKLHPFRESLPTGVEAVTGTAFDADNIFYVGPAAPITSLSTFAQSKVLTC